MTPLKVLGAGPVKRGITQLAAQFGQQTGQDVRVEFAGAPAVRERVLAGEAVDVVALPRAALDELAAQGSIVVRTRVTVGRSRMGLAVRRGAVAPDLASVDAFRRAVAAADAVVVNAASSGNHVVKLLEQLGFSAGKIIRQPDTVKVMACVAASTQNLLGAGQLPEIRELADGGAAIALAGPLPEALQSVTAYDAAAAAASADARAAAAFAAFLATAQARAVLAGTGID